MKVDHHRVGVELVREVDRLLAVVGDGDDRQLGLLLGQEAQGRRVAPVVVCELVAESGLMGSLEVVEVNPILDRENETARLAVELVASALGARIL